MLNFLAGILMGAILIIMWAVLAVADDYGEEE